MSNSRKRSASSPGGRGSNQTRRRSKATSEANPYEQRLKYLGWEEHVANLSRRNLFKRSYRISEEAFEDLADLVGPALMEHEHYYFTGKPSERGPSVPVEIRLAVGLRILAGGSHLDVCVVFGLPNSAAESMVGQVVDAINSREEVGASFLPRIKALCERYAKRFEAPTVNEIQQHKEFVRSRES